MAVSIYEIIKQVDIRQLYEDLTGEHFIRHKGAERARNIFREDSDPSLTYRPKTGMLYDFAEHKVYNHIDIVRLTQNLTEEEAIAYLYSYVGEKVPTETAKKAKESSRLKLLWQESIKNLNTNWKKVQKWLDKNGIKANKKVFDFLKVGLLPEQKIFKKTKLKDVGLSNFYDNALVFPLGDRLGRLTGFQIRHLDRKDFRFIGEQGFFGLLSLKEDEENNEIVLLEGEKDLICFMSAFQESEFPRAISYGSAGISEKLLAQIPYLADKFFVIPDNDDAGREAVKKIYSAGAHVLYIVDWGDDMPEKFDLCDHLKLCPSMSEAIRTLNYVSFAKFMFRDVEQAYYMEPIKDLKTRVAFKQAEKIVGMFKTEPDKEEFKELCKKIGVNISGYESTILTPIKDIIIQNNQYIKFGGKDKDEPKELTNFIINFKEEVELVSNSGKISKTLKGEVQSPLFPFPCEFSIDVSKTVDPKAFLGELRRQCSSELLVYPPFKESELYTTAMSFRRVKRTLLYIVPGRPISAEYCRRNFGTPYVFLYPRYSVIGGRMVYNRDLGIDVQLQLDNAKNMYWEPTDTDEIKEHAEFFVNELMELMYRNSPASWIPMGFSLSNLFKPLWDGAGDIFGATLIIHGRTGSKKSTITRFAQNFWGKYHRDSDLGQFTDTKNASKKIIAFHGMAQCTYDEFKPGVHSTEDLTETIHSVYSGRDKLRLSRDGMTLKEAEVIMAHFTFNTEQLPTLGESLLARSITLRMPPIYGTREEYEKVNNWSINHQYKLTPFVAMWMYRNAEKVKQKFVEFRDKIFKGEFSVVNNADRLAINYAKVLVGIWSFFQASLEIGAEIDPEIVDRVVDFIEETKMVHMNLIESHSFLNIALNALKGGILKGTLKLGYLNPITGEWETLRENRQGEIDVSAWKERDGAIALAFSKTIVNKLSREQGVTITQEALINELTEHQLADTSIKNAIRYRWYGNKGSLQGRGFIKIRLTEDTTILKDLYDFLFPYLLGKKKED